MGGCGAVVYRQCANAHLHTESADMHLTNVSRTQSLGRKNASKPLPTANTARQKNLEERCLENEETRTATGPCALAMDISVSSVLFLPNKKMA